MTEYFVNYFFESCNALHFRKLWVFVIFVILYETAKRKAVVEYHPEESPVLPVLISALQDGVVSNYAYFPVVFDGYKYCRDEIFSKLGENGIIARKYFYPLVNEYECYKELPTSGTEKTPVAKHIADRVLTLPLYADLAAEDIDRICDIILK